MTSLELKRTLVVINDDLETQKLFGGDFKYSHDY